MNYLDIAIVISLLYGLIKGFSRGLIKEVAGLLGFFIGVYIAINFSSYLNPKITEFLKSYEKFVPIISFVTLFIASIISIKILGHIVDQLFKAMAFGFVSRLLGAVFGFLKIAVILSVLFSLTREYKLIDKQIQDKSIFLNSLEKFSNNIIPKIDKHKKKIIEVAKENTEKARESIEEKINSE